MAMPQLADRLRTSAHWTRRQFELGHDVIATYQEASRADPEAARVWAAALAGRAVGIRRMIGGASGDLRPGLSRKRAVDVYIALTLAEAYRTLVLERGWTPDEFEEWLARALVRELVG